LLPRVVGQGPAPYDSEAAQAAVQAAVVTEPPPRSPWRLEALFFITIHGITIHVAVRGSSALRSTLVCREQPVHHTETKQHAIVGRPALRSARDGR
jgi:hypothetical protein